MIVRPGPGRRLVTEEPFTIAQGADFQHSAQQPFSSPSPEQLQVLATEQKLALVLADSMGECLGLEEVFTTVVKPAYNFEWIAKDVVDGIVNINRYKNIIIWAGAHAIHDIDLENVELDLRGLVNVIVPRNRKATINVSTLIPKPRENHLTAPKFQRYNEIIHNVVSDFQKTGKDVVCLNSDTVFLDNRNDIIRPITQNFDDGFHLNCVGKNKLVKFWVESLQTLDYVWRL